VIAALLAEVSKDDEATYWMIGGMFVFMLFFGFFR
jgi:hypothetical protein